MSKKSHDRAPSGRGAASFPQFVRLSGILKDTGLSENVYSEYPKIDYWSFRIIGLVIAACENALEMLVGKALYQKTALDVELDATFAGRLV